MENKTNYKKNIKRLFYIILFVFLFGTTASASNGLTANPTDIPTYVKNLYQAGLMLVGVAAFMMLIYGGYLYMFGGVTSSTVTQAKSVITNAILGLVLLVCAVLILRTINPQLINLNWEVWEIPAVTPNKQAAQTQKNKRASIFSKTDCECKCWAESTVDITSPGIDANGGCSWEIGDNHCIGYASNLAGCQKLCDDKNITGVQGATYEPLLASNGWCCCGNKKPSFDQRNCVLECEVKKNPTFAFPPGI